MDTLKLNTYTKKATNLLLFLFAEENKKYLYKQQANGKQTIKVN